MRHQAAQAERQRLGPSAPASEDPAPLKRNLDALADAKADAERLTRERAPAEREARALAIDHVKKRGLTVLPTNANMFMVDWKTRHALEMQTAFRAQSIEIGRSWPIWPTVSRITVGSMDEMKAFNEALDKIWA